MELAEISRKAVELLLERKITVSLAESCTGGMIASALVDWPGVSEALLEAASAIRTRQRCARWAYRRKRWVSILPSARSAQAKWRAGCARIRAATMRCQSRNCWAGRRHGRNARGAGLSGHCRQNGRARGKTRLLRRPDAGAPPGRSARAGNADRRNRITQRKEGEKNHGKDDFQEPAGRQDHRRRRKKKSALQYFGGD